MLDGIEVVTTALNLPGPAACARLRELGASVTKIEPPTGDPMQGYCPDWYRRLHEGMAVRRIDLKGEDGRREARGLLAMADVLVTAQRPSALSRMGIDAAAHPRLCHVAITGHAPPDEELAGHDLTYLAAQGLVRPPQLPPTLFADIAGAERAVSTALAMLVQRQRTGRGGSRSVALDEAAAALAAPLREGLTRKGGLLGGALAGYNLYAAKDGWIALAALEPHFQQRLGESLQLSPLTIDGLQSRFARETVAYWTAWARERDLPLAAVPPENP